MENKGLMIVTTKSGSRKMNYQIIDGKTMTTTDPTSKKVADIKEDSVVAIDISEKKYQAEVIMGIEGLELKEMYVSLLTDEEKAFDWSKDENQSAVMILTEM